MTVGSHHRLTHQQLWASFAVLTLMPYIRKKLDQVLDELRYEDSCHAIDRQRTCAYYFIRSYPLICFAVEASNLVLQLRYSVELSDCHSIWCQVTRTQLVARSEQTAKSTEALRWSSWLVAKYIAKTIGSALSVGAFFIQFLEYYYTRDGNVSLLRLPKPSPPVTSLYSRVSCAAFPVGRRCFLAYPDTTSLVLAFQVKGKKLKDFCLLCNERRENDTLLSTSGYIFCYSCIRAFVARNNKCPATGIPSSQQHLIRLYPPS